MKTKDIEAIEALCERWFMGLTTESEELALRRLLAACDADTPAIREAKAVMGYFAAERKQQVRAKSATRRSAWRVAASVAVVIGVAGALVLGNRHAGDVCRAWVGGEPVESDSQVLAMMQTDLSAIGAAAESVDDATFDEMKAIFGAIDL